MTLKIQEELQNKFYTAVMDENFDKIKSLIEKPSLRKFINVNIDNNSYFKTLCFRRNTVLIKYFLDEKLVPEEELKVILQNELKNASMQNNMDWFKEFCVQGIFHEFLAVEENKIECFKNAYFIGNYPVIKKLIYDFGVSRDEEKIVHIMRGISNPERFKEVINIFNSKKLHAQLSESLPNNDKSEVENNKPKSKIKI